MDELAAPASLYALVALHCGLAGMASSVSATPTPTPTPKPTPSRQPASASASASASETSASAEPASPPPGPASKYVAGCEVETPYGLGTLVGPTDSQFEVELPWGARAFVTAARAPRRKKLFEMSAAERVDCAMLHKERGNRWFGLGDFELAIREYEVALVYARQVASDEAASAEHDVVNRVVVPLQQNLAMTHLRLHNFADAVQSASDALAANASAIKALFYRGKARRLRGDFVEALADLKAALALQPGNTDVAAELERLKAEARGAASKARAMFSGIFGTSATSPRSKRPSEVQVTPNPLKNKRSRLTEEAASSAPATAAPGAAAPAFALAAAPTSTSTSTPGPFADASTTSDSEGTTKMARYALMALGGLLVGAGVLTALSSSRAQRSSSAANQPYTGK